MDPLEFEDIKEIFLQFKSLHKNIHEFTSKKSMCPGAHFMQFVVFQDALKLEPLGELDGFDKMNCVPPVAV